MFKTKDKNQGKDPFRGNTGDSSNSSEKYKNDELRDNAFLFDESNLEEVVDKRFEVCLAWYVKYSRRYKRTFYILMIVSTICPMVVTTLNTMDCTCARFFISFLSLLASISTSVLSLVRAQEKWTEYRSAAEYLKSKRTLYLEDINQNGKSLEKQMEFLKLIEKYMESENARWRRNNKDGSKDKSDASADNGDEDNQSSGRDGSCNTEKNAKESQDVRDSKEASGVKEETKATNPGDIKPNDELDLNDLFKGSFSDEDLELLMGMQRVNIFQQMTSEEKQKWTKDALGLLNNYRKSSDKEQSTSPLQ